MIGWTYMTHLRGNKLNTQRKRVNCSKPPFPPNKFRDHAFFRQKTLCLTVSTSQRMKLKELLHSDIGVRVLGAVPRGIRFVKIHSLVRSWFLAPVAMLLFSVVSHAEQIGFDTNAMREPLGFTQFLSPHVNPIIVQGKHVYVVNTPSGTVDVIDATSLEVVDRIPVGLEPVSLACRPDGQEIWVSNHVSDSVNVIDINPSRSTCHAVIATIQDLDFQTKSTRSDEPVGIAFANNEKAYIAFSSENKIGVVDITTRRITGYLKIPAQDPRAIAVRHGKLFVIPFESGNKSQLSGGTGKLDAPYETFDAWEHSIAHNNVLSIGHVVDIAKHPNVPDKDLFVFDVETDTLLATVESLGTLLYGLAVDSAGTVYITQTDARNDANGRSGTEKHGLDEMENRAFLNRITKIQFDKASKAEVSFIELEPLPPDHPDREMALATPYAIQISGDDRTLLVTASGSDKVFSVETETGNILGRTDTGSVPEGLALECSEDGKPRRGWVLDAVGNSVSIFDVENPSDLKQLANIELIDPTPSKIKKGRAAFETASASTTATFSCASCHPNGHTDQLLWVLKTPVVTGGNQIMPRSTMPIRGLRDTEPYHWDGIPGDPYGGIHSASVRKAVPPNSELGKPETSARHLIDGGLEGTMRLQSDTRSNDEGKLGELSKAERDAMAEFILSVSYPPAQRRAFDDQLSSRARRGFDLFHVRGDNDPGKPRPNVCGDCHRMPYWVSTNTPGTGMDAPTWRGAYDRWLILPQGRLNIIDFNFYGDIADQGVPEEKLWRFSWGGRERFHPVWDMVLEGSTGYSGALGRQWTMDQSTVKSPMNDLLLDALEQSDRAGSTVLQMEGVVTGDQGSMKLSLSYQPVGEEGVYVTSDGARAVYSRDHLTQLALNGALTGTFTARPPKGLNGRQIQPALWTRGPIQKQRGRQDFPVVYPASLSMEFSGRHIRADAEWLVDGSPAKGNWNMSGEDVSLTLDQLPEPGLHFLQVMNPEGLLSNEFLFHVSLEKPSKRIPKSDSLAAKLREKGWDRLIGTWVDVHSGGKDLKTIFAWKLKDRSIDITTWENHKTTVSFMAMNAQSKDVFQVGTDSLGGSFLGSWIFEDRSKAVFNLGFTSPEGEDGRLSISYRFKSDDLLELTLGFPEPIRLQMERVKKGK